MSSNGNHRLLVGKQRIMEYLAIGAPAFYEFVKMGLPARVIMGRWYAHPDNIDMFFKQLTLRGEGLPRDDAE